MLLPMFLQTDAVDDSLIDLRSGPPGFLNDPIFTPSNASQHPQHPQEAMHRTSAAMLGWGCQQVQVVTLFSDSLNMSAYKCVEMKLGLLLFCCKSKNEAYVRKNPGILLQRKAWSIRKFSPYLADFSINVPCQKAPNRGEKLAKS